MYQIRGIRKSAEIPQTIAIVTILSVFDWGRSSKSRRIGGQVKNSESEAGR
jgi:hypothetical protein